MLGLGVGSSSVLSSETASMSRGGGYSNEYSAQFDGTGDYIDTNYNTDSTFQDSFTAACWVRVSNGQGGSRTIFGGSDSNDRVWFYIDYYGRPAFYHIAASDAAIGIGPSTFISGANDWVHLAVVVTKVSGGNTTHKFYINGNLGTTSPILSITDTNHGNYANSNDLYIGALNNSGVAQQPYEGNIDEFGLWTIALSDAAITAIYNSGASFNLTEPSGSYDSSATGALELYYRFENDATDEGSAGSNGQVAGDTIFTNVTAAP
tara:strand:+ start:2022 stop:2810 length:789 start_codon:yes stop_codon:yes gene_type:complete